MLFMPLEELVVDTKNSNPETSRLKSFFGKVGKVAKPIALSAMIMGGTYITIKAISDILSPNDDDSPNPHSSYHPQSSSSGDVLVEGILVARDGEYNISISPNRDILYPNGSLAFASAGGSARIFNISVDGNIQTYKLVDSYIEDEEVSYGGALSSWFETGKPIKIVMLSEHNGDNVINIGESAIILQEYEKNNFPQGDWRESTHIWRNYTISPISEGINAGGVPGCYVENGEQLQNWHDYQYGVIAVEKENPQDDPTPFEDYLPWILVGGAVIAVSVGAGATYNSKHKKISHVPVKPTMTTQQTSQQTERLIEMLKNH
jgi:hypothetical protein